MMFKAFSCIFFSVCVSRSLCLISSSGDLCMQPTLQGALCESGSPFVLRVKVLPVDRSDIFMSELYPQQMKAGYYRLKIIQVFVFRPQGCYTIQWPTVFLNAPSKADADADAGISNSLAQPLELGVEYLLTGYIDESNRELRMDLCDFYKKWNEVSSAEKEKLTQSGNCL